MSLIQRGNILSDLLNDNLGVIYRKEFVDLQNSTIKDYEFYTGRKVDSKRTVLYPHTNSRILFMHIEEIDNIQNLNLGWFAIEQGDELDSDHEFYMLLGRLRRSLKSNPKFAETGLPLRSGFVIGNAGDHWGKKVWKDNPDPDFPCIEADTYQMRDLLPDDYFKGLEKIKERRPEIYKQYVLNSWDISSVEFTVIKAEHINALRGIQITYDNIKKIISCDPSLGGDECVIQVLENGLVVKQEIMFENDETKIAAKIAALGEEFDCYDFVVDTIGIGHGVATFLNKLVTKHGKTVIFFNSASTPFNKEQYVNKKAEIWFEVGTLVQDKKVPYPEDQETRRQLTGVRYEPILRGGKLQIEDKQKTKRRLKCSPDRGDCWVQGIYHLQFVDENRYSKKPKDNYKRIEREDEKLSICNF